MPRASDGDPLALTARKLAHIGVHGDALAAEANGVYHDLFGNGFFLFHVDEAKAVHNLPSNKEVPPQNLLFTERFILVHGFDAVCVGALDVIAAEIDLAAGKV